MASFLKKPKHFSTNILPKDIAKYCYSVWLRHLVLASKNGLSDCPKIFAELGPGNSLGVGLAALISGSSKYYALDIFENANVKKDVEVFDELVDLFKEKEDIPYFGKFSIIKPLLESYLFPSHILTANRLRASMKEERLNEIKNAIINLKNNCESGPIVYVVPWADSNILKERVIEMLLSQATLEHVENVDSVYGKLYYLLKRNGFLSLQIDFNCHCFAKKWNGYLAYSDLFWKLAVENRPFSINRESCSKHVAAMRKNGLKISFSKKTIDFTGITREKLARRFIGLPEEDLIIKDVFIQAIKSK